jgi:hypothetical protein
MAIGNSVRLIVWLGVTGQPHGQDPLKRCASATGLAH